MKYVNNLMRDLFDGVRECKAKPGGDRHTPRHGHGRKIIKGYSKCAKPGGSASVVIQQKQSNQPRMIIYLVIKQIVYC